MEPKKGEGIRNRKKGVTLGKVEEQKEKKKRRKRKTTKLYSTKKKTKNKNT